MLTYDISDQDAAVIRLLLQSHGPGEVLERFKPACATHERLIINGEAAYEHLDGDQRLDCLTAGELEERLCDEPIHDAWHDACASALDAAYEDKQARV